MKYLKIKNNGIIDEKSLYLLGASTKRNDSTKIGMFGSGNKYALAFLLRNDFDLNIYAGTEKISISYENESLGNQDFRSIVVNGRNTGITTDFGKDWELWQAIREIYCNAIDEGGQTMEYVHETNPKENETHFYISTRPEISSFFANYDSYFGDQKEILFENKHGKILKKHDENANLYRRGVKCLNTNKNSIFDYDFPNIDIDENRLVKYSWKVDESIWRLVYSCTNKELIKLILFNQSDDLIEKSISEWSDISASNVSEEFKEVLKEMKICNRSMGGYLSEEERLQFTLLPNKIFNSIRGLLGNDNLGDRFKTIGSVLYREFYPSSLHLSNLEKAKDFFKECEYEEPILNDIQFGIFDSEKTLAMADVENNFMILSKRVLEMGVQDVVSAIIEEYIHLKYKCYDETREMQNAFIKEMILILKIKNTILI